MRQTHTFLLTIIVDEGETELRHGRIQCIHDERESYFRNTEELLDYLRHAIARALPPSQAVRKGQSD